MPAKNKILVVDDDLGFLEIQSELLKQLPSQPEVLTADSGPKAIALLEAEPFNLLIVDLRLPVMDGFQVLTIVRRKFPDLRVVILTAVSDEAMRARAYGMGVELYWQKPSNTDEAKLFMEAVEEMLKRDSQGGFRGIHSKSLMDLIQIECLSQSSSVLRIIQGAQEGKVWVQDGNVIDASTGTLGGEEAFREIFSWKAGSFELLPAEPGRTQTIFNSYQGLLLDSAQALDESRDLRPVAGETAEGAAARSPLATLARISEGIEFIVAAAGEAGAKPESWGSDNPEPAAQWALATEKRFRELGEKLEAGEMIQVQCRSLQRHAAVARKGGKTLCVGFRRSLGAVQVQQTMTQIITKWES